MKRIFLILPAALIAALLLCGCGEKEIGDVGDDIATIASEVGDHAERMIDNGTVDDGDGYISEDQDDAPPTDPPTDDATQEASRSDGILAPDPTTEEDRPQ